MLYNCHFAIWFCPRRGLVLKHQIIVRYSVKFNVMIPTSYHLFLSQSNLHHYMIVLFCCVCCYGRGHFSLQICMYPSATHNSISVTSTNCLAAVAPAVQSRTIHTLCWWTRTYPFFDPNNIFATFQIKITCITPTRTLFHGQNRKSTIKYTSVQNNHCHFKKKLQTHPNSSLLSSTVYCLYSFPNQQY